MKVISLDCETNGLGGKVFCAAAVVVDEDGTELSSWTDRCPIDGPVDPWVAENVLPVISDVHERMFVCYEDLLRNWRGRYAFMRAKYGDDLMVIAHVAWPVETTFLRDAHADDLFKGPYPLIDVAPLLLAAGHDPTSVDGYLEAHGLPRPAGSPHHPLYDARAAVAAFRHLMAGFQRARMGIPVARP